MGTPIVPIDRLAEVATALSDPNPATINALLTSIATEHAETEERLNDVAALKHAALWYASHGIPVFPKSPASKTPLANCRACRQPTPERPNPHYVEHDPADCRCGNTTPCHGWHGATTDLDLIEQWWTQAPRANVALATGVRFDVIDVDGDDGYTSIAELFATHRMPSIIGVVATPSGGMHYYVTPNGKPSGTRTRFMPGLDFKGLRGWIDAPPSRRKDGNRYRWLSPLNVKAMR